MTSIDTTTTIHELEANLKQCQIDHDTLLCNLVKILNAIEPLVLQDEPLSRQDTLTLWQAAWYTINLIGDGNMIRQANSQ